MLIDVSGTMLATAQRDEWITLGAELGCMLLAGMVGRFLMKSRAAILLISFLGAFGAMVANIMVDGQGAFLYLAFTPVIYFAAVAGRHDLRTI